MGKHAAEGLSGRLWFTNAWESQIEDGVVGYACIGEMMWWIFLLCHFSKIIFVEM